MAIALRVYHGFLLQTVCNLLTQKETLAYFCFSLNFYHLLPRARRGIKSMSNWINIDFMFQGTITFKKKLLECVSLTYSRSPIHHRALIVTISKSTEHIPFHNFIFLAVFPHDKNGQPDRSNLATNPCCLTGAAVASNGPDNLANLSIKEHCWHLLYFKKS